MPEILLVGLILLLLLGAYWSMVLFPRQRELQKRQKYVQALQIGDEVVTYGGLIGKVREIDSVQGVAYLEIADGVVVRLVAPALIQPFTPETEQESPQTVTESK